MTRASPQKMLPILMPALAVVLSNLGGGGWDAEKTAGHVVAVESEAVGDGFVAKE